MKRYYYLLLVGILTLTFSFWFNTKKQNDTVNNEVILGKELAMVNEKLNDFGVDSAKIKEKPAELDNQIIKLNEELNALEDEVEIAHANTLASYYHDKFNGKKTASGDVFSNKKYTAAHKSLPFGTKVRVTNLNNEESIIVEINDRGPFARGRQIDLSKKAFMDLTHHRGHGTLNVKVEVLPENYQELKEELQDELTLLTEVPENLDLNEFSL